MKRYIRKVIGKAALKCEELKGGVYFLEWNGNGTEIVVVA